MARAHQAVVGLPDRAQRSVPTDAEDYVWILGLLLFHPDVMRPNAGVVAVTEAKMLGDLVQVGILVGADPTVGEGNMEQPAEQVLEHRLVAREQPADLTRIALEPGCAFASEIEHQPDVIFLAPRDLKDF